MSMVEEKMNREIKGIDQITNCLSSIENALFNNNVDKAIQTFSSAVKNLKGR